MYLEFLLCTQINFFFTKKWKKFVSLNPPRKSTPWWCQNEMWMWNLNSVSLKTFRSNFLRKNLDKLEYYVSSAERLYFASESLQSEPKTRTVTRIAKKVFSHMVCNILFPHCNLCGKLRYFSAYIIKKKYCSQLVENGIFRTGMRKIGLVCTFFRIPRLENYIFCICYKKYYY